jgi:hypothetical protein
MQISALETERRILLHQPRCLYEYMQIGNDNLVIVDDWMLISFVTIHLVTDDQSRAHRFVNSVLKNNSSRHL